MEEMCECLYCHKVHGKICSKLHEDNTNEKIRIQAIQRHADAAKKLRELFCAAVLGRDEYIPCPRECKLQCNLRCKYNFKYNCEYYCKCERKCECILRCKCRQQHSSKMSYIQKTFPFGNQLLMAFCQLEEDTYGTNKQSYVKMTARLEQGDCGALLSLLSAFNTNIITNTKQDIGVFEWVISIKNTDYTFEVPYPLTVGNYCRLMSQCIAHNQ